MNPILKKASEKDLKEIAEIYAEEFSKSPYKEPWTKYEALNRLNDYYTFCDIWKLIFKKEIIGFMVINTKRWYPNEVIFGEELAVKEEFQNRGFGSFILKEIFEIYKNRGFEKFIGIAYKKSKAFKLYKKLGMEESKEEVIIKKDLKWKQ